MTRPRRPRSARPSPHQGLAVTYRRAVLGAYVLGWLGPRALVRALARRRLAAALLLCAVIWAWVAYRPDHAIGRIVTAGYALFNPQPPLAPTPIGCTPALCDDKVRRALAANPGGQILHAPSVGVRAIWQAMQAAGSPLAGTAPQRDGRTYAEYIWDAGRASGVDPAVLMGMFNVESKYGRAGVARFTHSPGNIRAVNGQPNVDGYASYADWFAGIDATYALLRSYARHGAPTVDTAIPVWAPASDNNDPAAYIAVIKDTMAQLSAPR